MKYTLAILCFVALLGCNKSDSSGDSLAAQLANKKWQTVGEYTRDSAGTSANLWPSKPAYIQDDFWIWNSDQTYLRDDNLIMRPGGTNNKADAGTWSLDNSTLTLTSNTGFPLVPIRITTLTNDSLKFEWTVSATMIYMQTLIRIQ